MSLFSKPNREDFPNNRDGDRQYFQSLVRYTFWLVFIFAFIFGVSFVYFLRENESHQMVNLRGRDVLAAVKWLQERSLKPLISERIAPNFPRYHVVEQSPAPGTEVKENRTVSLVVSYGGSSLAMPSYRGSNYILAYQSFLTHLSGYENIPRITKVEKYSDIGEGLIVDHYPRPNQPINFQERIIFVVSRGIVSNQLFAENYTNLNFIETEAKLLSYGIRVDADYVASKNKSLAGIIVEQNVTNGTPLLPGMSIRFTVGFYDSQMAKLLDSSKSKVEMIRLYQLKVPMDSDLEEFVRNLNTGQELYLTPTNQANDFEKSHSVLIEITDQIGNRILFDDFLNSGEELNFPYRTVGKGTLRVLINGKIFETISFN